MPQKKIVDIASAATIRRRDYAGPALFSYGFRPFFLFGALWAALAVPIWIAVYASGSATIGGLPGYEWHAHEMLFGYLAAVAAGFLLTAVPNWTGRLPVMGAGLMFLFALWVAGRLAMLAYGRVFVAPFIDSAFLVALAALMWREVLAGRNAKNIPICAMASLLALANIGFHVGIADRQWHDLSERGAMAAIAMMIAFIGGRIVPSFTRNWMAQKRLAPLPAQFGWIDRAALFSAGLALAAWIFGADASLSAPLLVISGILHAIRLARWRGWRAAGDSLVLILHLGYLWLPVAFLLLGISVAAPNIVPPFAALHALTAGAMGTMTLAVMTRATLGHTGREKFADSWTVVIYTLVILGATVRVFASIFFTSHYIVALGAAAALWSGAFLLFVLRYGPMLWRPRLQSAA